MAFAVFPASHIAPVSVSSGGVSVAANFAETVGGPLPTMFLRVVKLGKDCSAPGGADPTLMLRAGTGAAVTVKKAPSLVSVRDGQQANDAPMATAHYKAEPGNVYLVIIRLSLPDPNRVWQLSVRNNDAELMSFTWVVADSDADSRQPWVTMPTALRCEALEGESATVTARVANRGTGLLSLPAGGLPEGTPFQVVGLPTDIEPNGCAELTFSFTAPNTPGETNALYTADTNDSTATTTPEHNGRITLVGNALARPPDPPDPPNPFGRCFICACPQFKPPLVGPRDRCGNQNCRHVLSQHLPPQ
ncbi:hypothetical protein ACWEK5_41640 [Rhodococcus koreensis]